MPKTPIRPQLLGDRVLTLTWIGFLALTALALYAPAARAAVPPTIGSLSVTGVTTTSALLQATINPGGAATRYRFEYGTVSCPAPSCTKVPAPEGTIPAGTEGVPVEALLEGLRPQTIYHFRLVAKNPAVSESADRLLATYGPTTEGLPDGRAYEQASPVDKDGGDAQGVQAFVQSTPGGDGISFGSSFGIPGGTGFGNLPTYLASRADSGWSATGLLPALPAGEDAIVSGWSPDYSRVYYRATRRGSPPTEALMERSSQGGPVALIAPFAAGENGAHDTLVGESADGSVVFFEAFAKLPPREGGVPIAEAAEGASNLYAWSRETGEVSLAGVFNQGAPKGSFAGPYAWANGSGAHELNEGGARAHFYLGAMHAVTPEGDVFFTAAGTGQLYERLDPTMPQSPLDGSGHCTAAAEACTIHVSASQKTNGAGSGGADPAGPQPAAFQAATTDGSQVFFTSSEKLTNDANTGPEQPLPAIGRAKPGLTAEDIDPQFLKEQHAVGVARHGPWLYWADPSGGTIGRVRLNSEEEIEPGTEEPAFIAPPPSEGKCEEELQSKAFKLIEEPIPSEPRYLAIDADHVYWTNTGRRGETGDIPLDGGGTIGRATLSGDEATVESIEPAFICGEEADQPGQRLVSDPQGIAVNESHIYWANDAQVALQWRSIARAAIDGSAVEGRLIQTNASEAPYGVALDASHLYFATNDEANNFSFVRRANLEGKGGISAFTGEAGVRGVALDAGHVYWATQGEGDEIGRCNLELEECDKIYIDLQGAPNGLGMGTSYLFWAVNGDGGTNPGNDLYRYEPSGNKLEDLTPLAGGDGAEVQGVLGVSDDGSYVWFAADGVLAAGATQGDCEGPVRAPSGHRCNLYLWHEGQVSFVAPLDEDGGETGSDAYDWLGSRLESNDRTSFLAAGGRVLVFRSGERLTAYDNTPSDASCGTQPCAEYYRYDAGEPGRITCLTCRPGGEEPGLGPDLGRIEFPNFDTADAQLAAFPHRNLSASGGRFFFETAESLVPADTNGDEGCRLLSTSRHSPACLDVYEWEAPGEGSCSPSSPSYAPLDAGCLFLVSTGKSPYPSYFGDADESGDDVFIFTRQPLVGQDRDNLQDVYDARVGGGLASQNPTTPIPCEGAEACHGPAGQAPAGGSPVTPTFVGPSVKVEKPRHHKKQKKHHKKKGHHHTRQTDRRSGR